MVRMAGQSLNLEGVKTMFLRSLDVKGCLNAVFGYGLRYGKSPCFLCLRVLALFGVDETVLNRFHGNGVNFFD